MEDFYHVVIIKPLDQAVCAQKKNIAAFVANRSELRVDELITAVESFRWSDK